MNVTVAEKNILVDIIQHDDINKLNNWLDTKNLSFEQFLCENLVDTEAIHKQDSATKTKKKNFTNSFAYHLLMSIAKPLEISASFGAESIFSFLWKRASIEHKMETVFACFKGIIIGTVSENKSLKILNIIYENTTHDQLICIMRNENIFGLRPLEIAMQHGHFKLFFKILKIPGLYLIKEENLGVSKRYTFDMSEYSPFTTDPELSRYWKSPLRLLQNVNKDLLPALDESELLTHGLILQWYQTTFSRSRVLFFIYSLGTVYHALLISTGILPFTYLRIYKHWYSNLSLQPGIENETYSTVLQECSAEERQNWRNFYSMATPTFATYSLYSCLIFYGYQVIVHTIIQIKVASEQRTYSPKFFRSFDSEKLTGENVFMGGRYLNLILMIALAITHYFPLESLNLQNYSTYVVFVDVISITTSLFTIFDTVFYLTFAPKIGGTVMLFLRSIETLVAFLLIYFASLVGFSLLLIILSPCLEYSFFIKDNILLSAFFTVFRLTLNIVDVPDASLSRLWFLQFILVIMVPIFILNFIIAIIADRVSYLSANQSAILNIHNLHVIMICESSFRLHPAPFIFSKLFGKVHKNNFQVTELRTREKAKYTKL